MDWAEWHRDYDDQDSSLSRRLAIVQEEIRAVFERLAGHPWWVTSLCAGEGRDLLGVLARHPARTSVAGALIEIDPRLARTARESCAAAGLSGIEVREADAGDGASYRDIPAADLLLVCGVFGNVSDGDAMHLVRLLPHLCAHGCTMIWTRHRRPPDLTPGIRRALTATGFVETAFHALADSWSCVGAARWTGSSGAGGDALAGRRLFTFVADEAQDWQLRP